MTNRCNWPWGQLWCSMSFCRNIASWHLSPNLLTKSRGPVGVLKLLIGTSASLTKAGQRERQLITSLRIWQNFPFSSSLLEGVISLTWWTILHYTWIFLMITKKFPTSSIFWCSIQQLDHIWIEPILLRRDNELGLLANMSHYLPCRFLKDRLTRFRHAVSKGRKEEALY